MRKLKEMLNKVWNFVKKMFKKLMFWKKEQIEKHPDVIVSTPHMLYGLLAFFVHTLAFGICTRLEIAHAQIFAVLISVVIFLLKEFYDKRVNGDKFRVNDVVSAVVGILFSAMHFWIFI